MRVELQDAEGQPLPGFSLADADELYGDSTEQRVSWNSRFDVGSIAGKPVRLRFVLRDADLFVIQFAEK